MGNNDIFLAVDRAHEAAELADVDFDLAVAAEVRIQTQVIRQQVKLGDADTISTLVGDWSNRVSQPGVTEELIRAAVTFGSGAAGQLLVDLIQKSIDAAAELAALKLVEQRA